MAYTVKQVTEILGISRDQLNYLRKKTAVKPVKKDNRRLEFSDEDILALRDEVAVKVKPVAALILLEVEAHHLENVAKRLGTTDRIVWSAIVYGAASIAAFTEQPNFDELTSTILDIHSTGNITHLETHPMFPGQYYAKYTRPAGPRFACIFLKVEYSGVLLSVLDQIKGIPEVQRCGPVLGAWDIFMEYRYEQEEHLQKFMMKRLAGIRHIVRTMTMITLPGYIYHNTQFALGTFSSESV